MGSGELFMKKYKKMLNSSCPVTVMYAKVKLGLIPQDYIPELPKGNQLGN